MVTRNLKLRYRRSVLGYLWTLLIPLSTAAIYFFLFKVVFKVQIPEFAAFVVTGILVWTFFSGTLVEGMDSLMANVGLLLQVNVPLNVFPITTAITNLMTLSFSLPVIVATCLINGVALQWTALMFFFYVALLFLQAYCLSYLLSISVIYLRDLRQAIGLVMQVWIYATPILYQTSMLPESYHWILYINPVGKIFTGIHNSVLRGLWPTPAEVLTPVLWTLVILLATCLLHAKASKQALERI